MNQRQITADVISCPGRLGDIAYPAVQLEVEGFESPYVLTLTLSAVGYRALAEQMDPSGIYDAVARAINAATPVCRPAIESAPCVSERSRLAYSETQ